MEEVQPLDLSMRPPVFRDPPPSRPRVSETKPSQVSPLCLIKDCGCNNHGPDIRATECRPVYTIEKYETPTAGECAPAHYMPSKNHCAEPEIDVCDSQGYECSTVPRHETCNWVCGDNSWESRRGYCEEQMDSNTGQGARAGTPSQHKYNSSFCAFTGSDNGTSSVSYSSSSKYYESDDHNRASYLDLIDPGQGMETGWMSSTNKEENFTDDSTTAPTRNLKRDWDMSTSGSQNIHWRPFVDSPAHSEAPSTSHPASQEISTTTCLQSSKRNTTCTSSHGSTASSSGAGGKVMIFSSAPSQPSPVRSVGHSFASSVPLVFNKASVLSKSEAARNLPLSAQGSPLPAPQHSQPTIRLTRSPKTFHNEIVRMLKENGGDGDAMSLCQDGGKRQVSDKTEGQEKENISSESDTVEAPVGVKMPALDYLISKVLVERIDIPFKPCNAEIKKIYNGESKGRLRLVDIIELQVEESLKA